MRSRRQAGLLALTLGLALFARAWRLDQPLFGHVDEAESTVNALTILQHGYPADRYLGLPLFENTLIEPWPGSTEYEFRDSSYSRRGLAVYHGWLPLYAIAGSLRLFGIAPHDPPLDLRPLRTDAEIRRMTVAARAPSVLAGMAFLVLLFVMADDMGGRGAAWVAVLLAAFSATAIDQARFARYYSLTTLLATACCYAAWRLTRSPRRSEFVAAGLLLGALFHTHLVGFLLAFAVTLASSLALAPRPLPARRWLALLAILAALTVPWVWLTGFLEQAARAPRALPQLSLAADLWPLLAASKGRLALIVVAAAVFAAPWPGRRVLPAAAVEALLARRRAALLLLAWIVVADLSFLLLMPAVSYSVERVAILTAGPFCVLAGLTLEAASRALAPRRAPLVVASCVAVSLLAFGRLDPLAAARRRAPSREELIALLRTLALEPGTRLYATPNLQHVLTAYTSLPVQSIAPVRKSFLDSYPGPLLLVEVGPFKAPGVSAVKDAARAAGIPLDDQAAQRLAWRVPGWATRQRLGARAELVEAGAPAEPVPGFLRRLVEDTPRRTAEWMTQGESPAAEFPAVFRGYRVSDWTSWWPVFFYRYVGPRERAGDHANYRERFSRARVLVLPSGTAVHISPAPALASPVSTVPAGDGATPGESR